MARQGKRVLKSIDGGLNTWDSERATVLSHSAMSTRLFCLWDSPDKNTAVGCHSLLQGIFPTQGWNPHLLHLQVDSLPQHHLGSLRGLLASKNFGVRLDLGSGAAVLYSPDPREGTIHSMKGNRSCVGALWLWSTSPPFCIKSTISCVHVVPCSAGKNRRHRHYLPHFLGCEQILVRAAV